MYARALYDTLLSRKKKSIYVHRHSRRTSINQIWERSRCLISCFRLTNKWIKPPFALELEGKAINDPSLLAISQRPRGFSRVSIVCNNSQGVGKEKTRILFTSTTNSLERWIKKEEIITKENLPPTLFVTFELKQLKFWKTVQVHEFSVDCHRHSLESIVSDSDPRFASRHSPTLDARPVTRSAGT